MQCAFIATYVSPPGISLTVLLRRELVFSKKGYSADGNILESLSKREEIISGSY